MYKGKVLMDKKSKVERELLSFLSFFVILFIILFYFLPDNTFKDSIEISALTAAIFHIPTVIKSLK